MAELGHIKGLREAMRLLVRRLGILERSEAECCGITLAQCHALVELGRSGGLSVGELAEILNLDKSTVSRSVDNLVTAGLVVREADANDRRYLSLQLSPQGQAVVEDLEQRMESYFAELVAQVPADKREQVLESLALLERAAATAKCCDAMRVGMP